MNKTTQNILLAAAVCWTIAVLIFVWLYFPASADAHFSDEYGWQRAQTESRQDMQRHQMNMEMREQTEELRRIREALEDNSGEKPVSWNPYD